MIVAGEGVGGGRGGGGFKDGGLLFGGRVRSRLLRLGPSSGLLLPDHLSSRGGGSSTSNQPAHRILLSALVVTSVVLRLALRPAKGGRSTTRRDPPRRSFRGGRALLLVPVGGNTYPWGSRLSSARRWPAWAGLVIFFAGGRASGRNEPDPPTRAVPPQPRSSHATPRPSSCHDDIPRHQSPLP